MDDTMKTTPCFAPEAQTTFTPGTRVYAPTTGDEGTFLGWEGTDEHAPGAAFVEWDVEYNVTRESFSEIRSLYL